LAQTYWGARFAAQHHPVQLGGEAVEPLKRVLLTANKLRILQSFFGQVEI
jgi:hypothetical protein